MLPPGFASASAPQPGFHRHKAGLKATFSSLTPADWGLVSDSHDGGPTLTGGRAVFTGQKWVRYNTTAYQVQTNIVAMNAAEDWVFSLELNVTAGGSVDKTLVETSAASGGNIFRILRSNAGGPDTWALLGGNGSGSYAQIGIFDLATGTNHHLAVHYKASNERLDFYLNGVGTFSNFMSRSGNYDIHFVHAGDDFPADGEFSMDDLYVGIEVEEPAGPGVVTSFADPFGYANRGVWRLTHDRALRAEANYHNVQCWSHDGRYTVYTLFTQGPGVGENLAEVHIVDLSTGEDILVDTGYNPRWANHTNWLFYAHFFDDFWRVQRYDVATSNKVHIANGMHHLGGGTGANDDWLFGFLRHYDPQQEWTPVRVRTAPVSPPLVNDLEFMPSMPGGSGVTAVNISHPVLELRYRSGDPVLGTRATLYDLDGTNERTGILLSEEGHVSWSGGGEYLAVGNQQVAARRWDEPYPADLEILANDDTQDISPMDRTDRYLAGASLKVFDLRSGNGRRVVAPRGGRVYPGDGDNSTLVDIDPKGSPDGTKIHYHSTIELKDLLLATIVSYDSGGGILHVDTTEGWPPSGHLVYRDKEVMSYASTSATSFEGIGRAALYSQQQSAVETGAGVHPLSSYTLTPAEAAQSHPDLIVQAQVAANGDPDPANNPLVYQAQTDCYIVVARLPDAPHLRVTNSTVELIPGERSAEIRHYRLLRDGAPHPDAQTFFEPGDSFPITVTGTFDAVAIEWSGLESPPGNEQVLNGPHTLQVLTGVPGNFSWIYEETSGATTNIRHRHDEEALDRLIGREFWDAGAFVHEDLDWAGHVTRRLEYDNDPDAGGTLLKREYWRHDGPAGQEAWLISEETYDPADGRKTLYRRYSAPAQGGYEVDRIEYRDGRPTRKFEGGSLIFDYSILLFTTNTPAAGGLVSRNPDQLGFGVGEVVTLTASPSVDYTFTGWSGDHSGTNNPDTLVMTGVGAPGVQFDGGAKGALKTTLGSTIEPDTFGARSESSPAEWTHNGTQATPGAGSDDDDADIRYRTTVSGPGAVTALSTNEDWVATITWERNDLGHLSHNVWELENAAGNDIFRVDALGAGNVRMYHNGVTPDPGTFGDYPVTAGDRKLTVHYLAAEQDIDFWIDDMKVIDGIAGDLAGGITTGLDLEGMRIRSDANGTSTSRDSFSLALAGQAGPGSTPSSNKSVTAHYAFNWDFTLDIATNPPAGGTVQHSPDQGGYDANDVVTLTAVPSAGYGFVAWSNDLSSSVNPVDITMSGNRSVAAHFDLLNHPPTARDDAFTIVEGSRPVVLKVLANDSTAPDAGETPVIVHVSRVANLDGRPGVAAPMTGTLDPPAFGKKNEGRESEWDFITEEGRAVARNNVDLTRRLSYKPTSNNDQTITVPMPTNAPWAFEVKYRTDGVFGERSVFRLYAVDGGDEVLLLSWVNDELRLTDGLTTSIVGSTNDYPVGAYYALTVHYQASNGLFDFYIDDVKILADRPLDGSAEINRFELRANSGAGEPTDYYDDARLGQAAWGSLSITGGSAVVYEPPPGFFGVDAFTYTVGDGTTGGVDTATVRVTVQEDQDGDGMPDAWEQLHGLDHQSPVGDDGADGDKDGEGTGNLAEFLAGTDANDANRFLAITGIDVESNEMVRVTWSSDQDGTTPVRYYAVSRLEGSMGDSNQWDVLADDLAPEGATTSYQDPAGGATVNVYRVGIDGP